VWCRGWEKEYAGIEFRFVDVISRRFLIVLLCVFFFEFGDDEWTDRGDEFLRLLDGGFVGGYFEEVVCECGD